MPLHLQGPPSAPSLYAHIYTLTCVTPACNVTVSGLFEHSLFLHGQTGGKDMTAEWHALSWRLAHCPRWQTNQGKIVIVALGVVKRVEDKLINGVLFFVLLGDEGVVVSHSDFIVLGAVSIPVERNRGMDHQGLWENEGVSAIHAVDARAVKLWALVGVTSAMGHLGLEKVCYTEHIGS